MDLKYPFSHLPGEGHIYLFGGLMPRNNLRSERSEPWGGNFFSFALLLIFSFFEMTNLKEDEFVHMFVHIYLYH